MNNSISLLLGAGFSAPIGYPIGKTLNALLMNSKNGNIGFHTSGSLVINTDGSKPDFGFKTSYDIDFEFCCALMDHFASIRNGFDYEEFYDYISDNVYFDKNVDRIAKPFISETISITSLVSGLKKIFNQLVAYYLHDSEGNRYYDNQPYLADKYFPGYTGLMKCISELSNRYIINIHTLNHDLFLESFNSTEFFKGELCDGFEELGSKYYGGLYSNDRKYMVRLSRYTGSYNKPFRLYKLHGSLDYELFYKSEGSILTSDVYIKKRFGIGHPDLYKEITNSRSELEYQNSWINYHPDFLTGTTSKIERYDEPLLFKKLFEHFKENLHHTDMLMIVGYGAKDTEINRLIFQYFEFHRNKLFIIDPYPGKSLVDFGLKLKAKFITKHLNDITINDLK